MREGSLKSSSKGTSLVWCFCIMIAGAAIPLAEARAPVDSKALDKAIDALIAKWNNQARGKRLTYTWGGYVNTQGNLAGDKKGLACNSFASPVLAQLLLAGDFRVLEGDGKSRGGKDYKWAHQWFGEDTADYFGLQSVGGAASVAAFVDKAKKGKLPCGVFYFDLRDATAKKRRYYKADGKKPGKSANGYSHTGFLIITSDGKTNTVEMRQFSGLSKFNGLAKGNFLDDYLKDSVYGRTVQARKTSDIAIYKLERESVATVDTRSSSLNLRARPHSKAKVLVKMSRGHRVQVLKHEDGWSKCRYMTEGKVYYGWAASRYLNDS